MIRRALDAVAYRFGYVREIRTHACIEPVTVVSAEAKDFHRENRSAWPPKPEEHGFTSATRFSAMRGGMLSEKNLSFEEVVDFLDACGLHDDEVWVANILSGWPFEIDGATMVFKALPS